MPVSARIASNKAGDFPSRSRSRSRIENRAQQRADTGFTQKWPFQDFVDTAEPACWTAEWNGQDMLGVALCSICRQDHTVGEVEKLSVRTDKRRRGIGRALLLDGLRSLRGYGPATAWLYTGTENPHRPYDLCESVGFRRQNEYARYRKPLV